MSKNISLVGLLASLTMFAPTVAHALSEPVCSYAGCPGGNPTVSTPNNSIQHPEIIISFWESGSEWTNGSQVPTRSQVIGSTLSLVNGPYWGAMHQYGTLGGGMISPARLSPYAPVFSGTPFGSGEGVNPTNFTMQDVSNVVNTLILGEYLPPPQNNEDMIYVVFVPNGSSATGAGNGPGTASGANVRGNCGGNGTFGCYNGVPYTFAYVGGSTDHPQSIPQSFVFSHEATESITVYQGVNVSGCSDTQVNQISDLCQCWNETHNDGFTIQAYWSVQDHACVIPETWGRLMTSAGWSYAWGDTATNTNVRQAYGGAGGVVYTNSEDNVYFYNGNPSSTDLYVGGPGSEFAAGGNIIAGITLDTQYGVNYFNLSTQEWTAIGAPNGPVTSVTVTHNGVIYVTDTYGQPWYWHGEWTNIGGPGDQFVAWWDDVMALNPTHTYTNYWNGSSWYNAPANAAEVIASADAYDYGYIPTGTGDFEAQNENLGLVYSAGVSNGYESPLVELTNGIEQVDINDLAGTGNEWYSTGESPVGRIISGSVLFGTACTSGKVPCVNY